MITPCPHLDCENRTGFGYCKTTACINPMHSNLGTAQYGQGVQRNIITNEERFNAMTTEEKADYIRVFFPELCPPRKCPGEDDCRNCWLDWLKQEVTEEA